MALCVHTCYVIRAYEDNLIFNLARAATFIDLFGFSVDDFFCSTDQQPHLSSTAVSILQYLNCTIMAVFATIVIIFCHFY